MGSIQAFNPVKLFIGVLVSDSTSSDGSPLIPRSVGPTVRPSEGTPASPASLSRPSDGPPTLIPRIEQRLRSEFGPTDHQSNVIPFRFTDYYKHEMGAAIDRVFFSFERLIEAHRLPEIKRHTNLIEAEFASGSAVVKRPANLDPGYLEHAKVVLATTKNFYHRMYLGNGIFGEVTMHFKNNAFQFFPWTYPDYQSPEYLEFFLSIRRIYRNQLRSMCLLRRRPGKPSDGRFKEAGVGSAKRDE